MYANSADGIVNFQYVIHKQHAEHNQSPAGKSDDDCSYRTYTVATGGYRDQAGQCAR